MLNGKYGNIRDPNKFGAWDKKIGFFIGNAGKSRGQSPRYLCHVIKSPDDRLRESFDAVTQRFLHVYVE